MATPRKRKATTPRKQSAAKSAKRSTSRRPVAKPADEDEDVFIPSVAYRTGSVQPHPTGQAPDEDIFVATPGRPVTVQADWIDDTDTEATAPLGVDNEEFFTSLDGSAGSDAGWTTAALAYYALTADRRGAVHCRYGCDGSTSNVVGAAWHHHACAYWDNEGKRKAPF